MKRLFKSRTFVVAYLFVSVFLLFIRFPNGPKLPPVEKEAGQINNFSNGPKLPPVEE